jgi:hypothetical protein
MPCSVFAPSAVPRDHALALLDDFLCECAARCTRKRTLFHSVPQQPIPCALLLSCVPFPQTVQMSVTGHQVRLCHLLVIMPQRLLGLSPVSLVCASDECLTRSPSA